MLLTIDYLGVVKPAKTAGGRNRHGSEMIFVIKDLGMECQVGVAA